MLPHINQAQREDITKENKSTTDATSFINHQIESIKYYYNKAINNPHEFYLAASPYAIIIIVIATIYIASIQYKKTNQILDLLGTIDNLHERKLLEVERVFKLTTSPEPIIFLLDNGDKSLSPKDLYCLDTLSLLYEQKSLIIEQINLVWEKNFLEATIAGFVGAITMGVILAENNPIFFDTYEQ
jgi:hypothetical protein